jgi:7-cyano-7-deazaguanine reductase
MAKIVETPPSSPPRFDVAGYDAITPALLETFPYEYPGTAVAIDIETDEFTAVCPWSGLPDFGAVKIRYLPGDRILELRSLKYYFLSYRNVGIFQEHAVIRILDDLVKVGAPQWMEITLDYKVRGGLHTVCRARHPFLDESASPSTAASGPR